VINEPASRLYADSACPVTAHTARRRDRQMPSLHRRGVRRPTVTLNMGDLQKARLVETRRGRMERRRLERATSDSHAMVKALRSAAAIDAYKLRSAPFVSSGDSMNYIVRTSTVPFYDWPLSRSGGLSSLRGPRSQ
jgi:hypothetical protein